MNRQTFHRLLPALAGALLLAAASAGADVGQVQYLTGTLTVQKPDGSVRILSQKSPVAAGDTLTTQRDTFAQINFVDGSRTTLRPNTQFKIEDFKFSQEKPENDNLVFRLVKGGLRTVTGLIGKRGNLNAWQMRTNTATIGIRGSTGEFLECSTGCEGTTPTSGGLPPGLYAAVLQDGFAITAQGVILPVGPGQFALVEPGKAPVLLPSDPGMGLDNMPFLLGIPGGDDPVCKVQ